METYMLSFRGPCHVHGFSCIWGTGQIMTLFNVYLDEFGHIGPYLSRKHPKYKESPVFGLAGFIIPTHEIRGFSTWFYQQKCRLLDFEIKRSHAHPATWEKKGSALYTVHNVKKYRELRNFTNRLFNKIDRLGGHLFYVGLRKTSPIEEHNPKSLYLAVLREAIKRLNSFCEEDCQDSALFTLIMDEHEQRLQFVTEAARAMFNSNEPRRCLVEPPFQVESHLYQTVQAADWIAGLVGRMGCHWQAHEEYPDFEIFSTYFEARLNAASVRSGMRSYPKNTPGFISDASLD